MKDFLADVFFTILFVAMMAVVIVETTPRPPPKEFLRQSEIAWDSVARCSGLPLRDGGHYSDIKFKLAPDRVRGDKKTGFASYAAPDTILLHDWTPKFWGLAHEMVHFRAGERLWYGYHPLNPFLWPCKFMGIQNGEQL
jgi:hypothetical protein